MQGEFPRWFSEWKFLKSKMMRCALRSNDDSISFLKEHYGNCLLVLTLIQTIRLNFLANRLVFMISYLQTWSSGVMIPNQWFITRIVTLAAGISMQNWRFFVSIKWIMLNGALLYRNHHLAVIHSKIHLRITDGYEANITTWIWRISLKYQTPFVRDDFRNHRLNPIATHSSYCLSIIYKFNTCSHCHWVFKKQPSMRMARCQIIRQVRVAETIQFQGVGWYSLHFQ